MSETVEGAAERYERRESEEAYDRWSKTRRTWRPTRAMVEGSVLFAIATAGYGALGIWLLRDKHLIVGDGFARLSHAYFVWWNLPPKLTAIGFIWPPVATLVFLPFAAVKPLATSLIALPLMSAVFGGLLLVVLDRLFQLVRMTRLRRYPLLVAFGVNPMVAFYASNGMAEIVYLFFLVAAVYAFLRWYLTRAPGALIVASVCFALGILSRYEVFIWAAVLTVTIALTAIRQRVSRAELEGTLLTYLAPIAYGAGLWLFFNWLILGDPLYFLKLQAPGAGIDNPGGVRQSVPALVDSRPGHLAGELLKLNVELYPVVALVVLALVLALYRRRDLMTLSLIVLLVLNAAFTWLLVWRSGAQTYLQLRYNMRAMPLALVAIAWIYLIVRPRWKRLAWAASLAAVVASIPFTAYAMEHYAFQYLELDFMGAVLHDKSVASPLTGVDPMARYITAHDRAQNSILVDDSQTFGVMLRTGRPDLFWDRIDKGDAEWRDVLSAPWGRVRYMLMASDDLIAQRYPRLYEGKTVLGMVPLYVTRQRTQKFVLVLVADHRTPPRGAISRR